MRAEDIRLRRTLAVMGRRSVVDMAYARDLAERRTGPAAQAAAGRALNEMAARGGNVEALSQGLRELFELADGILTEQPSPTAVAVAERLADPGETARVVQRDGGVDLVILAHAVLHLDEVRRLDRSVI